MKATLIQPYYHNIWESIGLGYIGAYAKQHTDVELDFYQAYFDSDATILENAKNSQIVAFSCTSPTFKHAVNLSKRLKELNPKVHILFGGTHVSSIGEEILVENTSIDQIVIGEGEKAFCKIINGERSPIVQGFKPSFDQLVWPDRDLIKNHRTIDFCEKLVDKRIASFQANRGCPFRCKFCSERAITGIFNRKTNPIRTRPIHDLLNEITAVNEKYKLDYFKFVDATFDISPEFVISFCKEKISKGINLEWECMLHATFVNEEMFYWLKESNCNQVNIGCESGSSKILKQTNKGVTVEKIRKAFAWGKKHGVKRRAFLILGTPEETEEDHQLTEDLLDEIKPDVIGFTILCPYPGSDFYSSKFKDIDWSKTDEYSNTFWCTKNFTNQELKEKQEYFIKKYENILCERQETK